MDSVSSMPPPPILLCFSFVCLGGEGFACQRDFVMPIAKVSNFIIISQVRYLKIFLY